MGFGYGILLYIRKTAHFALLSLISAALRAILLILKSAILCLTKTEVADFVSFKESIVQGINLCNKYQYNNVHKFDYL